MEWGSSQNYKDIARNFDNMKQNFTDKGFPVIIDEVGIYNDYIKKNNSIEQFLYTLFSMSCEYEVILPCLWDIPMTSSNYKNFILIKKVINGRIINMEKFLIKFREENLSNHLIIIIIQIYRLKIFLYMDFLMFIQA